MKDPLIRRRLKPLWLPIVEVDFVIRVFKDPKTVRSLHGVRRQVVEKAMQCLYEAKRNQIDGQVELEHKDIGLILQAMALTIDWLAFLLFFRFEDDEQI